MRIVFITNGLSAGGSERVLSVIANELAARQYEVSIVCVRGITSFYPIDAHIRLIFLDKERHCGSLWEKMLWIRKWVKRDPPDIIITFIVRVYGFTLLSLAGCHIPVITSERNDPRSFPFLSQVIMRLFLPLSSHHVVQTADIKAYYPSFIRKKTTVIANPVSPGIFSLPSVEKKDVVVCVGRLVAQKNHRMLINSFAAIADRHPSYQLVIYGEGPLRERLMRQVRALGMEDRIFLPGRTKDLFSRLREARIFCLSSLYEGMSNALIEAMCLRLPVITTRVSGVDELIRNEENGLVIPVNDEVSYSEALDRLMGDKSFQTFLGENHRHHTSLFNINTITMLWEHIIQETRERHYRS